MAVVLRIRDSSPWSETSDMWVVPSSDALRAPGSPVDGQTAYGRACAHDEGDPDVQGCRLDYTGAKAATGVTRAFANPIGNAYTVTSDQVPEITAHEIGHVLVAPVVFAFDPTLPCPLRANATSYIQGP